MFVSFGVYVHDERGQVLFEWSKRGSLYGHGPAKARPSGRIVRDFCAPLGCLGLRWLLWMEGSRELWGQGVQGLGLAFLVDGERAGGAEG